jgi:hypothetical protein
VDIVLRLLTQATNSHKTILAARKLINNNPMR